VVHQKLEQITNILKVQVSSGVNKVIIHATGGYRALDASGDYISYDISFYNENGILIKTQSSGTGRHSNQTYYL